MANPVSLARPPLSRGVHPLREQQPIGQTRQDIAVCKLLDAFLGRVLQRQVAHEANALYNPAFIIAQRNP